MRPQWRRRGLDSEVGYRNAPEKINNKFAYWNAAPARPFRGRP